MTTQVSDFTDQDFARLRPIFNAIRGATSMSSNEKRWKRQLVDDVLWRLTDTMSSVEPLFKKMFVEFIYTGSYFDGLRIRNANEFDINVVLGLPVRSDKIRLDMKVGPSTYAYLGVDYSKEDPTPNLDYGLRGRFQTMLNDQGSEEEGLKTVHPKLVLSWMQSVVNQAFHHKWRILHGLQRVRDITIGSSGPALTLKISTTDQNETVDVDLVPTFRFEWGHWHEEHDCFNRNLLDRVKDYHMKRLYLIPKLLSDESKNMYWRKHLPGVENHLLGGIAKPVIKILKMLRDNCNWNNLASYYIKTLVMNVLYEKMIRQDGNVFEQAACFLDKLLRLDVDNENVDLAWDDRHLPQVVFSMMATLANRFQSGRLPHLMYPDQNLFQNIRSEELDNYSGHIRNIMRKCKADISKVNLFFMPRSVLTQVEAQMQQVVLQEVKLPLFCVIS